MHIILCLLVYLLASICTTVIYAIYYIFLFFVRIFFCSARNCNAIIGVRKLTFETNGIFGSLKHSRTAAGHTASCAIMSLTAQFVRNLRSFRLVTFDVTDTLVKLNDPIGQYVATAAACGVVSLDKSKMAACFGQQFKWMSKTYPNFGCSSSSSPSIKWQDWWRQLVTRTFACVDNQIPGEKVAIIAEELLTLFRTSACWTPVPGAQELVHRMRLAGKCVGVISNFDPSVAQVLDAMGFDQLFDFILSSYEAGVMKPDPGIFQLALGQAKISSANQALHIGNKYDMDYAGARQSGWSSLLVQPHLDAQLEAAAHHTFGSLAEMLEALETQEIRW